MVADVPPVGELGAEWRRSTLHTPTRSQGDETGEGRRAALWSGYATPVALNGTVRAQT